MSENGLPLASPPRVSIAPYRLICYLLIAGMAAKFGSAFIASMPLNGFVPGDAPFGGDFLSFYTASQLALSGNPALAYDIPSHLAAQQALFGDKTGYLAFFYPPTFLLMCLPLALTSYVWSVLIWLSGTLAAYALAMRRYGGDGLDYVPIFAFSGVFITVTVGQNALLSTALMGAGTVLLQRRPVLAGIAFGLLCYKPHLGLMLPFVLLAAGQWRAIISGAMTVLVFSLASLAAFGVETWVAFLKGSGHAVLMMETSDIGFGRMIMSFFGAVTMLGGPIWLAYGVQALFALMVIGTASWFAFRIKDIRLVAPMIAAGTVLITPFLLAYDLTLLAIPLVWLYGEIQRTGELPGERIIGILAFAIPGLANMLARDLFLPAAPFVSAALFYCLARRAALNLRAENSIKVTDP